MCGRYAFFSPAEAVKRAFAADKVAKLEPRYNVAPTQGVPALRADASGTRVVDLLHWGLVPRWAKERAIGNRMINARAETIAEKPAFRDAFRKRRCLVLADGWYEWQVAPGGKQPWFICMKDRRPFAFAGLWERWRDPADGAELESCTFATTEAAPSIREIHHRMPVVLGEDQWPAWLDPANDDVAQLTAMLGPFDPEQLQAWPVSRRVNSPKNEGPALIEQRGPEETAGD